jgi:hypothetical protein
VEDFDVAFVASKLLETAEAIRGTGARVVIVSPTPASGWDTGHCLMRSTYFGMDEASCDFPPGDATPADRLLRMVGDRVPVYWLADDVCGNGICDAVRDGVLVYRDGGHLSIEGSAYLGRTYGWMARFREMAR